MAHRYEYAIDKKAKEVAIKELNEDPSQINAHIESLRRWVTSMPHLQCPTDSKFLLRFLRVSKFDHIKAQKRIDNFCTVRTSERGFPYFFQIYSVDHCHIENFLKIKMFIPLGKIDSGETVILMRYDNWDPDTIPLDLIASLFFMGIDVLMSEEECQIFGLRILFNLYGISKKMMEIVCDQKLFRGAYSSLQDAYPIRLKGQIYSSDSVFFATLFQLISFFLNEKMKSRTTWITNDIKHVRELIPGLQKILPTEYHGYGGSLDQCVEKWNERFRKFYKDGHPLQSIRVDESKRPKETLNFLSKHVDFKSEAQQNEGTYTKFENVF